MKFVAPCSRFTARISRWHAVHIFFDVDNTLYPTNPDLEGWLDTRINGFIADKLAISLADADHLRLSYWQSYGTTITGLLAHHHISAKEYFAATHPLPAAFVTQNNMLKPAIAQLEGQKIAFTNGTRAHGAYILEILGLNDLFTACYGIEDSGYIGKPHKRGFENVLRRHEFDRRRAYFFEDSATNLLYPKAIGMRTVLIGHGYAHGKFGVDTGPTPPHVDIHCATIDEALKVVHDETD